MYKYFADLKNVPKINCDLNLLKSRFPTSPDEYFHKFFNGENTLWLSRDFEDWLLSFGIFVIRCDILHTNRNRLLRWHTDTNPPLEITKINWVFEEGISYIEWGDIIGDIPTESTPGAFGKNYLGFSDEIVKTSAVHRVVGPTLFNAGIPHRVDNRKDTDRWCLSAILWYRYTTKNVLWHDALDRLKNHLK